MARPDGPVRRLPAACGRRFAALLLLAIPATAMAADADAQLEQARQAIVQREPQRALAIWTSLAEAGNAEAQYQLGVQMTTGRWIERDLVAARRWLQRAAEQGHARAQYNLGRLYADGDGGAVDPGAARRWYQAAAEQGYRPAQRQLEAGDGDRVETSRNLISLVRRGDVAAVRVAVRGGDAGVNAVRDDAGRTPLMLAAEAGEVELVDVLLEAGADPAPTDPHGNSALLLAVRGGHVAVARRLLARKAPVDQADDQGNTPLLLAVRRRDRDMVGELLRHHADPNHANRGGAVPLQVAQDAGADAIAEQLRAAGGRVARDRVLSAAQRVDPNRAVASDAATRGWPPLVAAAWRGQSDLLRTLLDRGATVDATDPDGHTALTRAALRGETELVGLLLERGADIAHRSRDGRTAVLHAAAAGHRATLALLARHGADLRARAADGRNALALAVDGGQEDMAVDLLQRAPELVGEQSTLLARAIDGGMTRLASAVLSRGEVDPRILGPALPVAVRHGDAALTRQLLDAGAKFSAADGAEMLASAIAQHRVDLVELLIGAGVDLDGRGGPPALVLAAGGGDTAIVQRLLDAGVDVDARDAHNKTALMLAAQNGHPEVVDLLLRHRADPNIRNRDGDTALDLARRGGHAAVVTRIEQTRRSLLDVFRGDRAGGDAR